MRRFLSLSASILMTPLAAWGAACPTYTCTCTKAACERGSGHAASGQILRDLPEDKVLSELGKTTLDRRRAGWMCEEIAQDCIVRPPAPAAVAPPPAIRVQEKQQYTCKCARGRCGGAGAPLGEAGQVDSGISEQRLSRYLVDDPEKPANGWVCSPPRLKYQCLCTRDLCGGGDIAEGERGQRSAGLPIGRVLTAFAPPPAGAEATGWSCEPETQESRPTSAPTPQETEKSGIFSLDLLAGGALGVYQEPNMGVVGLRLGVAVSANRNAYLVVPFHAQLRSGAYAFSVGLGFQYDARLYKSLYLTPRATLGYTALVAAVPAELGGGNATAHLGSFTPELGLKYVFNGRVNLGADLISLPILFNQSGTGIFYRVMAFVGVNL